MILYSSQIRGMPAKEIFQDFTKEGEDGNKTRIDIFVRQTPKQNVLSSFPMISFQGKLGVLWPRRYHYYRINCITKRDFLLMIRLIKNNIDKIHWITFN